MEGGLSGKLIRIDQLMAKLSISVVIFVMRVGFCLGINSCLLKLYFI